MSAGVAVRFSPRSDRTVPNFDRLARVYRWMEWFSFGPLLGWCRCAHVADMTDAQHALVLGDGDGRFTAKLLAANPVVMVDAVDGSEAMLATLKTRARGDSPRVRTQAADLRNWSPEPGITYDLVTAHFFLDCLTTAEVERLARRVRQLVSPGACWVVSEFAVPQGWFGRLIAGPVVAFLYCVFRWLTGLRVRQLPQHREGLRRAGFRLVRERRFLMGLLVSEIWNPQ